MNSQELKKEAERAMLENRNKDAIGLLDMALQKDPNDLDALYLIAQALSNLGDFPAALEHYDRLLHSVQNDPIWQANALISKSDALIELNRLDEAERCLDLALGIKPRLARGWVHKARIEARRQNFQRSLEYGDRAISVDAKDCRGWNNRAYALCKLKRYKECIESAKKALSIKPDYVQALIHMKQAYLEMGKMKEFKKCEEKIQAILNQGGPKPERTVGHKSKDWNL